MNLPGLLVEYLINGCIALIWLLRFEPIQKLIEQMDEEKLLFIPVAYVIGMFIDFIAWILTHPFKGRIREDALKVVQKELADNGHTIELKQYRSLWSDKVEIEKKHPGLNKELLGRSSRDRIARGTIINMVPISILYWNDFGWIGIALLILSALMWVRFEHYNHCFEVRAAISVRNDSSKTET